MQELRERKIYLHKARTNLDLKIGESIQEINFLLKLSFCIIILSVVDLYMFRLFGYYVSITIDSEAAPSCSSILLISPTILTGPQI